MNIVGGGSERSRGKLAMDASSRIVVNTMQRVRIQLKKCKQKKYTEPEPTLPKPT